MKVICHMISSVDGKIKVSDWGEALYNKSFSGLYEECHNSYRAEAWLCGRVTMSEFANAETPVHEPVTEKVERIAFIADPGADSFAIAADSHGKLGWKSNEIGGDHIIQLLSESVSDGYLLYLQKRKISYLFAGKEKLDLGLALKKLKEHFPIDTLMVEGGGTTNGTMLQAGLIDELSLLIAPVADGTAGGNTIFDVPGLFSAAPGHHLKLLSCEKLGEDVIWLKYACK
ncbi:dihydrofolate reductase family protein [Chitinophaga sp. Cy-1792]|uniref:dihydrofolate reductase family protein n=1 Tax=Chitinophaga sp. Cy-1792 TaxID=2608339 RepID=UPI00141ECC6F|nr:RibD family protein [Chitinophaga sp. Cy-1792]NIG54907.1 RibD family protein [Chitinophaga sp. Cy-1792]